MKKLIILSSSLNEWSMTFFGLKKVEELAKEKWFEVSFLDFRKLNLPFCDGRKWEEYDEHVHEIGKQLEQSDYLVFGTPVYCYSLSWVLKNFIDIFSGSMMDKKFWVFEQAGSKLSYLAAADLQKIVWFECKSQPIFPIVLTDYGDYRDGELTDTRSLEKIEDMLSNFEK
jgi:FMN reductase/FAD reductase [NAD(P)H]